MFGNPLSPPFDSILEYEEQSSQGGQDVRTILLRLQAEQKLYDAILVCQQSNATWLALNAEDRVDEVTVLPSALFNLHQLQKLLLFQAFKLQVIPQAISGLENLEVFNIYTAPLLGGMPEGVLQLTQLKVSVVAFLVPLPWPN